MFVKYIFPNVRDYLIRHLSVKNCGNFGYLNMPNEMYMVTEQRYTKHWHDIRVNGIACEKHDFPYMSCTYASGGKVKRVAMVHRKNTIETFARVVTIKILQTHNTVASLPDHCRVYSGTFLGFQADGEARGHPDAAILTLYANSLQSE